MAPIKLDVFSNIMHCLLTCSGEWKGAVFCDIEAGVAVVMVMWDRERALGIEGCNYRGLLSRPVSCYAFLSYTYDILPNHPRHNFHNILLYKVIGDVRNVASRNRV